MMLKFYKPIYLSTKVIVACCLCIIQIAPAFGQSRFLNDPMVEEQMRQAVKNGIADQLREERQKERQEADIKETYAPMEKRLRASSPGFGAYADFRFTREPGRKHFHQGLKRMVLEPWNPAERVELLGNFQQDYDQMNDAERDSWETTGRGQAVSSNRWGTSLSTGSLETGSLGSGLESRKRSTGAPTAFRQTPPMPAKQLNAIADAAAKDGLSAARAPQSAAEPENSPAVEKAKRAAAAAFPDLSAAGSPLNRRFVSLYQQRKVSDPAFFDDSLWPRYLALEAVEALMASSDAEEKSGRAAYLREYGEVVDESERRAGILYPDVQRPGSALAREVRRIDEALEAKDDPLCHHPGKPLAVTQRAAANLSILPARPGQTHLNID